MWVEQASRWLGRKDGELVVYFVWWYHEAGKLDTWHITHYDVECEETGVTNEVPYDTFQKLIASKRLINIGEYTKEAWLKLCKQ